MIYQIIKVEETVCYSTKAGVHEALTEVVAWHKQRAPKGYKNKCKMIGKYGADVYYLGSVIKYRMKEVI